MQKYQVLLILGVTILVISIFNIVTVVLNITREGFTLYDTLYKIDDDARLKIERSRYDRSLLNNQDNIIKSFEQTSIDAERNEFGTKV